MISLVGKWLIIIVLSAMKCGPISEAAPSLECSSGGDIQHLESNDTPVFSPDGTKMVFPLITADGAQHLFLANSDGSNQTQITFEGRRNHSPAWSPYGRNILFVSDRDGDDEIWMMDADGSYQHPLTFNQHWDGLPTWSSDGREIRFVSNQHGSVEMYAITDGAGTIKVSELDRLIGQQP